MTHVSKQPCGSTHDYVALSLPPPYRIVNSASCSTSSETEAPQTTAKAESFPQPLESFHLEAPSIGRKETQSDTYTDISNNDVAGVSSNFGETKDIPSIEGDPPLQKADSLDLRVYTRITESPALYGQGHHLDDKLDAESKSSSDEKTEQTAEDDEKHNFIIEKVDNMHRVEDGEGNPEVRFSEMKVPWNPMHNIPMVVMDADGEPQALSVIVDTGAACSLIPDEVVRMLRLKKHPIQAFDRQHPQKQIQLEKFYSPLGGVSITPTHFVNLKVKGHRIGLDKYVDTHVRVLETENTQIPTMSPTDIVFGMPFIMRNNIFQRFLAMPRDGNPFYALLKGKQSDAQKTEDRKVKEENRALAERVDRIESWCAASQRVATSTATRDLSDASMGSWDRIMDWQSWDSSNTSQTMASGSGKDFYRELEDVSSPGDIPTSIHEDPAGIRNQISSAVQQELGQGGRPSNHAYVRDADDSETENSTSPWLIENARSSALLTERKGTNLEAITRKIDAALSSMRTPKSRRCQVFQAIFDMDWDLPNFLRGQEYDTTLEIAVERAITVTGSSINAQALSCMDYMCQTWPSSGREVVLALQKALISPNLSCSSCLADGTELYINLRSQNAMIVARGGHAALTELCEQLAWLGAALRTSPVSFGICLTTPSIVAFEAAHSSSPVPSITVQLGFTVTSSLDHGLSADVDGTCWHAMFRNPVVVNGFPILARHENEQGLELPLDMMSILAEAHFATRYDTTLVLKGLCTMLVPTGRTERSITWHFIFNEDGKRLPYYSFRERCPGWIGTDKVSTDLLEDGNVRNFVGWASNITRHLGAEEMKYDEIDWAGARECSAGLAVEQKLTISVSKIVGGSGSVVRGNKDKPVYVEQSAYSMQIKNARNIYVVLYDVAARRGWLADGVSALLHLVRTQVVREPYGGAGSLFNNLIFNGSTFNHPGIDGGPNAAVDILKEDRNMKHIILREFDSYSDEKLAVPRLKAVSTAGEHSSDEANNPSGNETPNPGEGRKEIYKTTCLRELVSQTWSTLERIYDRQIEVATTHITKELQNPFRTTLEGYEFMDIVSTEHILTRRTISFQSNGAAWTGLTRRIHAITLFGQHFGDIYKPAENVRRPTCENWKTVPQGHEYLVAPISLLKEIKLYSWKKGKVDKDSEEIAEGLLWSPSEDAYNICGSSCKHTFNRVQQLHSSTPVVMLDKLGLGKNDPRKADNFAEINGAIIFGNNSDLDVGKLELLSPSEVHTEGDRYDSGVGSSLQTSSRANSATQSSSDVNPDSQPARPSADRRRTSPYPLDQMGGTNMSAQDVRALVPAFGRRGWFIGLQKRLSKTRSSRSKIRDAN